MNFKRLRDAHPFLAGMLWGITMVGLSAIAGIALAYMLLNFFMSPL